MNHLHMYSPAYTFIRFAEGSNVQSRRACTEHWIVRDAEGKFWIVLPVENAWESRRPFQPTEETHFEAVPGR
jgi:hypothetical protein